MSQPFCEIRLCALFQLVELSHLNLVSHLFYQRLLSSQNLNQSLAVCYLYHEETIHNSHLQDHCRAELARLCIELGSEGQSCRPSLIRE